MKTVFLFVTAATLVQCHGKTIPVSDACGVIRATLYEDGQYSFTDAEIDALREVNQQKIVAIKNWYRKHC
jgi:hypothetical protein